MWAEGILDVDFLKVHYELCEVSNGKNIWANCPFLMLGKVRVDKQELLCSQKRWLPTSTMCVTVVNVGSSVWWILSSQDPEALATMSRGKIASIQDMINLQQTFRRLFIILVRKY